MNDTETKAARDERLERFGTVVALLIAGGVLQAMHAPESVIGSVFGAAAALTAPGGGRGRVVAAAGTGALLGAVAGGWVPGVTA